MVWKDIRQRASPQIPPTTSTSFLTEQARRGGYMGSEFTEFGRNHHHHNYQHHQQHFHPRNPHLLAPPHQHLDMHEAIIQREMEKERIREEIIMSEMMRRRVLEAEVRREMMLEREYSLRNGGIDGFPFGPSSTRAPLLGVGSEGRSLEERIAFSVTERERLNGRHVDSLPFQTRSSVDLRISEVKVNKEKEKIILMAKPEENISGSKRKAPSPPTQPLTPPSGAAAASEPPRENISKKKAAEKLTCSICQVSTTSEQGLSEHKKGKKHKSKESALRAGKNYAIGLLPTTTRSTTTCKPAEVLLETSTEPVKEDVGKSTSDSLLSEKRDGIETLNSNESKKNESVVVEKGQKNERKKWQRFWCEICQVGTPSQKIMNAHKKGKKHLKRSSQSLSDEKCKIVINVNCEGAVARDGDEIAADNVDEAFGEDRSDDVADHSPKVMN
ncbi:hypothetical protein ABFS83_10G128500 [Erythranthe nasuta]